MEANVPDRDDLGRFTAWAKKKGGEAIDSIRKGAGDAARSISVGADKVADELGAAPRVRSGMETDDELEAAVTAPARFLCAPGLVAAHWQWPHSL